MQHCQKSRLDLSPHFPPHLLELIILVDFYIWQGPIRILEVPTSSEHPFTGRFRAFKFFVLEGLLLEDGDENPDLPRQSCIDPYMDFSEIGFVFRALNARQWRQ